MEELRKSILDAKRIVVKIGTTSITHEETGSLNSPTFNLKAASSKALTISPLPKVPKSPPH